MTRPPLDELSEKDRRDAEEFANERQMHQKRLPPPLLVSFNKLRKAFLFARQSCPCRNAPQSEPAPSDLERDTPITVAFTYAMAGHVKECEDAIRELVAAAREKEREFWVMKFEHWVECQKDGGVAASFKAQGFTDCVAAMKQNDRWVPHAALKKGKPNG